MIAADVDDAVKRGDQPALASHIENLARFLRREAEQAKIAEPRTAALLDETAKVLSILSADLNQPADSRGWHLRLKRIGRGNPSELIEIKNLRSWSRAMTLALETKLANNQQESAIAKLKTDYGISRSTAMSAKQQVEQWKANQHKADGMKTPILLKNVRIVWNEADEL